MTGDNPAPAWTPTASGATLRQRAELLSAIRFFFEARGVIEVETPILSHAGNSDPGLRQFTTRDGRWLRTSPEYALKRLLAAGGADTYELGRVFRAGESGPWHNPEFTLLEWYRLGWPYPRLMEEVVELVEHCGRRFGRQWRVERLTYRTWLQDTAGIDPLRDSTDQIMQALEPGLSGPAEPGTGRLSRPGGLAPGATGPAGRRTHPGLPVPGLPGRSGPATPG